jgi:hypothetical protein
MSEFPRGTVKRFRQHLNATVPDHLGEAHWQPANGGRAGARSRGYGDWLYSADREMFFFELREQSVAGRFTP